MLRHQVLEHGFVLEHEKQHCNITCFSLMFSYTHIHTFWTISDVFFFFFFFKKNEIFARFSVVLCFFAMIFLLAKISHFSFFPSFFTLVFFYNLFSPFFRIFLLFGETCHMSINIIIEAMPTNLHMELFKIENAYTKRSKLA